MACPGHVAHQAFWHATECGPCRRKKHAGHTMPGLTLHPVNGGVVAVPGLPVNVFEEAVAQHNRKAGHHA